MNKMLVLHKCRYEFYSKYYHLACTYDNNSIVKLLEGGSFLGHILSFNIEMAINPKH